MTGPLEPKPENFPALLLPLKRWCVWKSDKNPYQSENAKGKSNDPTTWLTYAEAETLYKTGKFSGFGAYTGKIGDAADNLIFFDWDHTNETDLWGVDESEIINEALAIGSYTERSPSGTGLHVLAFMEEPPHGSGTSNRAGGREVYWERRYFTLTGHRIDGSPSEIRESDKPAFKSFYDALLAAKKNAGKPKSAEKQPIKPVNVGTEHTTQQQADAAGIIVPDPGLDDDEVISLAEQNYKNKFRAAREENRTGDRISETDQAFCNYVAPYASGVHQIAQLLQTCRPREKTLERPDYNIRTATLAWNDRTLFYNPKKNGLSYISRLANTESSPSLKKWDDTAPKSEERIQIYAGEPPEVQMQKTLAGLHVKNDPPVLFVRSGRMVRIISDERRYPSVDDVTEVALRHRLYECCDFLQVRQGKDGELIKKRVRPSIDCLRDVLAGREWVDLLPPLVGVTNTPVIHPDGYIVSVAGYDPKTALYYHPEPDLIIPPIPLEPTRDDINTAVKTLWEPFKEFKFVDIADGTHVIAGLISIVCRNLITGSVPMLVIDKPTPGTGASLISQIIGLISEGRDPATTTMPKTEEEWRKKIISTLSAGRPSLVVDNIEGRLKSPALAALLTTREYSDRKLGTSDNLTMSHHIVWIANGNNVTLAGDLPRRVYWSRMDSESVRPWADEKQYVHPDIRNWTIEHRGEILASILILARAWIQAKRPKPDDGVPKLGGFESWRDVIGGILSHAGIPGFLTNLQKMYEISDVEVPQWDLFFEVWYLLFGSDSITTRDLYNAVTYAMEIQIGDEKTTIRDALPEQFLDVCDKSGSFVRMMGHALSKRRDRRYPSGYKLVQAGEIRHAVKWKVEKVEKQSTLTE